MQLTGNEDLRVQKTITAIRETFEAMICEMNYEQITVKELTARAKINKKTFYHYYPTLDDLLRELQNKLAQKFMARVEGMEQPKDMDKITREFFLSVEELGALGEKLICNGNYKYINRKVTNDILSQTVWYLETSNPYIQNIVMRFVSQSTLEMYKQWVADGKQIPLEEMITLASELVCNGVKCKKL